MSKLKKLVQNKTKKCELREENIKIEKRNWKQNISVEEECENGKKISKNYIILGEKVLVSLTLGNFIIRKNVVSKFFFSQKNFSEFDIGNFCDQEKCRTITDMIIFSSSKL